MLYCSEYPQRVRKLILGWLGIKAILLTTICLGSCGGPPSSFYPTLTAAQTPLVTKALYCPGEYLKWSLRWRGIQAASTEIVTGQPGIKGKIPTIIVYSVSRSSELATYLHEVREELKTELSLTTGLPLRNTSNTEEDGAVEETAVEFAQTAQQSSYETVFGGSVTGKRWTQKEETAIHDLHSVLAHLRTWQGEPKEKAYVFVQNGRSHYRLDLTVVGNEKVQTPAGEFPAVRLYGQARRLRLDGKVQTDAPVRRFSIWRSDDLRFLPLRFEFDTRLGLVRGSLVEFQQPESAKCLLIGP